MVLCAAWGCNNRSDTRKKRKLTDTQANEELREPESSASSSSPVEAASQVTGQVGESQTCWRKRLLSEKLSYHTFPSRAPVRKKWMANYNREPHTINQHSVLCSVHFEPECFEDSYWCKVEFGYGRTQRKLKEDAVPTLFKKKPVTTAPKQRTHTEERIRRKRRTEEVNAILEEEDSACIDDNEPPCIIPPGNDIPQEIVYDEETSKSTQTVIKKTSHVGMWAYPETSSIGTQCDIRESVDVETQTEQESPVIFNVHGSPSKVFHDHSYQQEVESNSRQETAHEYVSSEEEPDIGPDTKKENDPDWGISSTDGDTEDEGSQKNEISPSASVPSCVSERKYIVFQSALDKLFQRCQQCGELVLERDTSFNGSLIRVESFCTSGHNVIWFSQPMFNHFAMGNVLLSAACLFSGATYHRLHQILSFLGVACHSPATFYDHQDILLFPVVAGKWKMEKLSLINELSQRSDLTLIGDGRCDSPGYSAKYGTYTLMDSKTYKIVDFEVVQVTQVSSSVAMEKEGLKQVLQKMRDVNPPLKIKTLATDRHIQIAKFMAIHHPDINHQFDIWHFAKNITSRLHDRVKTKKHSILRPWVKVITNHLWYSAANCQGCPQLLRERWTSVVHHITNEHSWDTAEQYHQCDHGPLDEESSNQHLWLKSGSPSHKLLQDIVFDPKLLAAMDKLTEFCHTGALEVAHSLYLKYMPKRQHFIYKGMVARTMLAALDNNSNVGRQQATIKSGIDKDKKRFRATYPKGRKDWVAKPILEDKDYSFVKDMMETVVDVCKKKDVDDYLGEIRVPLLPSNISRTPMPKKDELVAKHVSRMQMQ